MSADKIISAWKNKTYKPVYWLEGEEPYFIDQVMEYAENHILSDAEAGFNLSIFYGKDSTLPEIINSCRRYPMFSDKQVVLLKEAQQMRDIEKLEAYIENPLKSTVFIVSYKDKKIDGRTKFARLIKEKGELLSTKKMYENQLPGWIQELVVSKGMSISKKGIMLLVDHIGNDLSRISNEIDKIAVNLGSRKNITEDDIEEYIGISKEYNAFELQSALMSKDMAKAIRIIQYFESNPKIASIQLVLPSLYSFFSKIYMIYGMQTKEEKAVATITGIHPFFVKDYLKAAALYTFPEVESALLLLHQYNLKSIGVNDAGTKDASLLKEMLIKMIAPVQS